MMLTTAMLLGVDLAKTKQLEAKYPQLLRPILQKNG
jgi:hypothetical protein